MKKQIIIYVFLFILCLNTAKAEVPDTLLYVDPATKLIITESQSGTFVEVTNKEGVKISATAAEYAPGSTVKTSQSTLRDIVKISLNGDCDVCHSGSWDLSVDGLCVGLNNAQGQTLKGLQWSKSFEISWLSCININYSFSRSDFSLGFGFDWRNYKATIDGRWLIPSQDGGIQWGTAPKGVRVRSTRLKVFSLQVPFLYEWKVPKSLLSFKAGPIACFNTYASIKGFYEDFDGNQVEFFTKDFSPRRFTVDFFGSLSYGNGIGIYVRYSPMKVLNDSSPLNFHPFTLGIGFFI